MTGNFMKSFLAVTVSTLILGSTIPAYAADKNDAVSENRAAQGDITKFGGARRLATEQTDIMKAALHNGQAKNVILFIGDGMGDSEITVARNYAEGAAGFFKGIDALPITGQYTHYALDKKTQKPDYVTDSAASATAWSSGVKTYNGALGIDVFGNDHETLIEIAKRNGKATGNVTTSEIQDATPAAQFAHVSARKCYGPEETSEKCAANALENGGIERGYNIVRDANALNNVTVANQDKPVLGLFHDGNMAVAWEGPKAVHYGNINNAPLECKPNSKLDPNAPTLAQMTKKAIDLLEVNPNGFFLQVESASIDKQDHKANPCGQIGETVALDEAVQVGLDFAKQHGDTLVIVTADHSHSSQIIPEGTKSTGLTQALITKDGSVMVVNYGNSEEDDSQEHTGAQLRVAAYGPHAANVMGLTDQTDLFFTMRDAMGLKQ